MHLIYILYIHVKVSKECILSSHETSFDLNEKKREPEQVP